MRLLVAPWLPVVLNRNQLYVKFVFKQGHNGLKIRHRHVRV